jgi:hypothetical protein
MSYSTSLKNKRFNSTSFDLLTPGVMIFLMGLYTEELLQKISEIFTNPISGFRVFLLLSFVVVLTKIFYVLLSRIFAAKDTSHTSSKETPHLKSVDKFQSSKLYYLLYIVLVLLSALLGSVYASWILLKSSRTLDFNHLMANFSSFAFTIGCVFIVCGVIEIFFKGLFKKVN